MSSTYSTNLTLELIGTGDQAGNWGSTTNVNLGTLLEQAISGYYQQPITTGATVTLAMTNGADAVARNMFIELTGTGGTSTNLVVPNNKKLYFIYNNTSGAVTVKVSGLTGVSVPAATKLLLVCNGTDIVKATSYLTATDTIAAANAIANTGGWAVTPTGTKLYFSYNGTNVASLDSTGNLITLANITAYGTP
jgi:hypothetical protein